MNLGNSLFHARKKSGLSQEVVAEKIGVSRQTISKWETNETVPDVYQSKKMAKLYKISLDELIEFDVDLQEVEEMIAGTTADIIFCGHTHVPCGYQTNTKQTVVNVGSVGRPFSQEPKSCYAILEINNNEFSVKHNFVPYDVNKAADILKQRGFDGAEKLAKMLICATSRYPQ